MLDIAADRLLTFDALRNWLFDASRTPINEPVDDYRFAAGLLFERFNDGSERTLYLRETSATIEIIWFGTMAVTKRVAVPVTEDVVQKLCAEGLVEGIPRWGRTDEHKMRLSLRGKQRVVRVWFTDAGAQDCRKAGAIYDADNEKWAWSS